MEMLLSAAAARADIDIGDVARSLLFSDDGSSSSTISAPGNLTSTTNNTSPNTAATLSSTGSDDSSEARLWFKAHTIQKKGLVEFQLPNIRKDEWIRTREQVYLEDYYATKRPRTNKATGKLVTKREPQTHGYELDAAIICDGQKLERCCNDCKGAPVMIGCYSCQVSKDTSAVSIPVLINMVRMHNNRSKDSNIVLKLTVTKLATTNNNNINKNEQTKWEATATIPFDSQKRKQKSKMEKNLLTEDHIHPISQFKGKWYANDLLGIDITGTNVDKYKLRKWLTESDVDARRGDDNVEPVLLLVVGAFNPIHKGHKIMIDKAVKAVTEQWFLSSVIGIYLYPLNESDVSAKPSNHELVLPTTHRVQNIEKTNFKPDQSIPVLVGPFDGIEAGSPLTIAELVKKEVNEVDPRIKLLYVCGDNHFKRFELHRKQMCVDGIVCVPKTPQSQEEILKLSKGSPVEAIVAPMDEAESYEELSARNIQKKLKTDPKAVAEIVDAPVAKCLAQHFDHQYCNCERDATN